MIRGRGARRGRGAIRGGRGAVRGVRGGGRGAGRGAGRGNGPRGTARVGLAAGVAPKPSVTGAGRRGPMQESMKAAVRELGGATASAQFAAQADSSAGNKDAARAFYPPLKPGRAVSAAGFQQAPHEATFFDNMVVLLEPGENQSRVEDCAPLRGRARKDAAKRKEDFWAPGSLAVVPGVLPWEVRHDAAARARRKKRKILSHAAEAAMLRRAVNGGAAGGGDEDDQGDEDDPDKEKDPDAAENVPEEEEDELDVDYQATARFDDDDGYISQDSGNDAPLF